MLETKNLCKIYKPKKSVPVRAIDGVSLKFADTGMVFLLGKSGSGKSTLLNLLGGLDTCNSGEIITNGVSSKSFSQRHFDSYRNTYVGFIFQEYNVLEDFTVGANIALALELQNRKATDVIINKILEEVDLAGYGNRKPNELSGGQKQRVAIARALVKSPEIIMADEPTGALDSNTGRQVLETLKKLSKEKLVIVVSHDRDFASRYADRIIELSDGRVISDTTLCNAESENTDGITFNGDTATVPRGYHLTEEDRKAINEYIEKLERGIKLEFKNEGSGDKKFMPTDTEKIVSTDKKEFKLIKSKLSLKNSFKIGSSSLKYKKVRLVITVLLSCIAFGLFGLADTLASYDHIKTCTNSIYDTKVEYASLSKSFKVKYGDREYWHDYGHKFTDEQLKRLSLDTDREFTGVWVPETEMYFIDNIDGSVQCTDSNYEIYSFKFSGVTEINEKRLENLGYKLTAGKMPDGSKNEIAISEYTCKTFIKCGYFDGKTMKKNKKGVKVPVYQKIKKSSDMVGKVLTVNEKKYTVVGIVDTLFDFSRYERLTESNAGIDASEELIETVLIGEFYSSVTYGYTNMMMTGDGFIKNQLKDMPKVVENGFAYMTVQSDSHSLFPNYISNFENVDKKLIQWVDGERTTLGEKEVIATTDMMSDFCGKDGKIDIEAVKKATMSGKIEFMNDKYDKKGFVIVGFIDNTSEESKNIKYKNTLVISDSLYKKYYAKNEGDYFCALSAMPKEKEDITKFATYAYEDKDGLKYVINNPALYELDAINQTCNTVANVFLYVGLGFALFAAIMLANFIATSISHKKQEIGILRAIGSRGSDIFRIFFAESFIIAMINFVLSTVGVLAVSLTVNYLLREKAGILLTVLDFGVRQVVLLFAVSVVTAFLASLFPVIRIASKKPIDAIMKR